MAGLVVDGLRVLELPLVDYLIKTSR